MGKVDIVKTFWKLLDERRFEELTELFHPECKIVWPNTSEDFTPEEYIRLNKDYPGSWKIDLEDVTDANTKVISVVRIKSKDNGQSLRGIGYFHLEEDLIYYLLEYFAPDTEKPEWR